MRGVYLLLQQRERRRGEVLGGICHFSDEGVAAFFMQTGEQRAALPAKTENPCIECIALVLPPGNIFLAHTEYQMQKRPADTRVGKLARL